MTARDYKPVTRKKRSTRKKGERQGSVLSFISGLSVGLVIAFGVYLWSGHLRVPGDFNGPTLQPGRERIDVPASPSVELPEPRFDFYKILPEMEVPISDWELGEESDEPTRGSDPQPAELDSGTYLLQVGSFKSFEDADRVKATLALSGIGANIQRVVINGQDVWYRVHVGPLSSAAEIRAMRIKLLENDMDFMLLRIGADA